MFKVISVSKAGLKACTEEFQKLVDEAMKEHPTASIGSCVAPTHHTGEESFFYASCILFTMPKSEKKKSTVTKNLKTESAKESPEKAPKKTPAKKPRKPKAVVVAAWPMKLR